VKGFVGGGGGISGKKKKSIVEESWAACTGVEVRKPCMRGRVCTIGWEFDGEGR
jgi:hypothetical protein